MFAQDHPEVNSLEEVVRLVKPTAIIGRKKSCHPAQLTLSTCRWRLSEESQTTCGSTAVSPIPCLVQCHKLIEGLLYRNHRNEGPELGLGDICVDIRQ